MLVADETSRTVEGCELSDGVISMVRGRKSGPQTNSPSLVS